MVKRSSGKIKYGVAGGIFLLILITAFLTRGSEKKPLEGFWNWTVRPVAGAFSAVGGWFGQKTSVITSIGEVKEENNRLKEENLKLKFQLAQLASIQRENEELRSLLALAPADKYELESVLIVGRDINGQKEVVYLSKGSKDGIEEGMGVVVGEGVLIGKISKVFSNSSQMEFLVSDMRVNAEIVEAGAKGVVIGRYETAAVMEMIPRTVEIEKGDAIITSGVGNTLPRGLLIGYVLETNPASNQLFQEVSIEFLVDFQKIRGAWVVKKAKVEEER
jgi:rod shape-determining protein MreC